MSGRLSSLAQSLDVSKRVALGVAALSSLLLLHLWRQSRHKRATNPAVTPAAAAAPPQYYDLPASFSLCGRVAAVCRSPDHKFSKPAVDSITLVEGMGIESDAHFGRTVQHLSRLATRGHEPNLRQVHLIHSELHSQLNAQKGFTLAPGHMGENVTTEGIDLLEMPVGTLLTFSSAGSGAADSSESAVLEVTGLRHPCPQLDTFCPGLMAACNVPQPDGSVKRLAGIMTVIRRGGVVRAGDQIRVTLPSKPYTRLVVV